MSIEIILWDFGDTLVDQRWMLKELPGFSGWPKLFRDEIWDGELGNNMKCNTDEWVERGGKGYWYRDESSFISDIAVIL